MLNVAVIIATPTPTHFDVAKMALQADKHVLVRKPLTLDYERAQELVALKPLFDIENRHLLSRAPFWLEGLY